MISPAKRVLLHAFSTFKLGGPQSRFVKLANTLGPNYLHIVAAMDNCFDAGDRLAPYVNWRTLPLPVKRGGALANFAAFRQVLKAEQPDLLLTYNWGTIEWTAANLPRLVPQVHVEDGFGPEEVSRQLPRRVWTRRVLLGWTGTPVVVASRQLAHIATHIWKLPNRQLHFIANGVDVAQMPPVTELVHQCKGSVLTIGTVAGLRTEKNISRLIRAFAEIRANQTARLVIVGEGPELPRLQVLAATLGISEDVEFTGYMSNPLERLLTFDLFALSSDTEQLPIAMLEAMACRIPVVATNVGDVSLILPDIARAGLADPTDASFISALSEAISQREQWPQWAAEGQKIIEKDYSLLGMQTQWKKIFDSGCIVSNER